MVKYIDCPKCGMSFSVTDKELDSEQIECPYCNSVIKIRKPPLSFGQNIDYSEQGNTQYLPSVPVKTEVEKIAEQREIEEKAQEWIDQTNKKINKDRRIIASLIIFSVALGLILAAWGMIINKDYKTIGKDYKTIGKDYETIDIDGETYYHRLTSNTWSGNYQSEDYYVDPPFGDIPEIQNVVSYTDYLECIKAINNNSGSSSNKEIVPLYKDETLNYIVLNRYSPMSWCYASLIDCIEYENSIVIVRQENNEGFMGSGSGYFIAIPTKLPIGTELQINECYTTTEISNLQNYGSAHTLLED